MTMFAIFVVDKMAIQYGSVIKIQTTPVSIVAYVDTWLETVSIVAEEVEEEAEIMVEEAEVEDELNLEEGEVMMLSWLRKRRKKKTLQWLMVGWAKPISESQLMECLWMLTLITELSLLVDSFM